MNNAQKPCEVEEAEKLKFKTKLYGLQDEMIPNTSEVNIELVHETVIILEETKIKLKVKLKK